MIISGKLRQLRRIFAILACKQLVIITWNNLRENVKKMYLG